MASVGLVVEFVVLIYSICLLFCIFQISNIQDTINSSNKQLGDEMKELRISSDKIQKQWIIEKEKESFILGELKEIKGESAATSLKLRKMDIKMSQLEVKLSKMEEKEFKIQGDVDNLKLELLDFKLKRMEERLLTKNASFSNFSTSTSSSASSFSNNESKISCDPFYTISLFCVYAYFICCRL